MERSTNQCITPSSFLRKTKKTHSCIALGDPAALMSRVQGTYEARKRQGEPYLGPLQDFLLRVLLASAQVDTTSLPAARDSRVFENHEQLLLPAETQMPSPDTTLQSQSKLPLFFTSVNNKGFKDRSQVKSAYLSTSTWHGLKKSLSYNLEAS